MALLDKTLQNTVLPEGYLARPVTLDDVEAITNLFNVYWRSLVGDSGFEADEVRNEWETPNFVLANDTMSVWKADGEPVGYMEFWDIGEPHVRLHAWIALHPEHLNRGIESFLLDWVMNRAQQNITKAPEGTRVVLHGSTQGNQQDLINIFEQKGFAHIRTFYRMRIELDKEPALPVLPEGITIRSIEPGEEKLAFEAVYDSFHDHWGFIEEPFEQFAQRWQHNLEGHKDYDPALWFIAMDGEEVAAVSLCYNKVSDDADMAWVGTLGVRRPWRKKGLGLALLQHSFREFHQRGKPRAGLGVDASSLTGATRLYERAGMYVERKQYMYELVLREGKDLLTQTAHE